MSNQLLLENEIKNYTHDLLATHVVLEYGYQIDEWQKYINRVLDAEKLAHENMEGVLKKVIDDINNQPQYLATIGMFALSLLGGAALSWISGAIQYKLFPKLTGKWELNKTGVYLESKAASIEGNFLMIKSELDYNKVTAKVFGDAASNLMGGTVGKAITQYAQQNMSRKTITLDKISEITVQGNTSSNELHQSLKTKLENALLDEKQKTIKTIAGLALFLRNNPEFGKYILEELFQKKPGLKSMNDDTILREAKKLVEDTVDLLRKSWAENWFYYGHNPPNTSIDEMSRILQREMWALWIIDQNFIFSRKPLKQIGNAPSPYEQITVNGRNGIPLHKFILFQLMYLNVLQAQMFRGHIQSLDPRFKSPNINVGMRVDTAAEIDAINNWAKNHPLELLAGNNDSQKRALPSVLNIHKQ